MTTGRIIPQKVCAWCHEPYTPDRYRVERQQCCSQVCARRYGGLKRRGQAVPHLVSASQRRAALRIASAIGDRFGMLSPREREIFRFAHQHGYDEGYNAGIRPVRRTPQEPAA